MVFFYYKQAWKHGDDREAKNALFITIDSHCNLSVGYTIYVYTTIINSLVYLNNTTVSFHSVWQEKLSSIQIGLLTIIERLATVYGMCGVVGCPYTTD